MPTPPLPYSTGSEWTTANPASLCWRQGKDTAPHAVTSGLGAPWLRQRGRRGREQVGTYFHSGLLGRHEEKAARLEAVRKGSTSRLEGLCRRCLGRWPGGMWWGQQRLSTHGPAAKTPEGDGVYPYPLGAALLHRHLKRAAPRVAVIWSPGRPWGTPPEHPLLCSDLGSGQPAPQ